MALVKKNLLGLIAAARRRAVSEEMTVSSSEADCSPYDDEAISF